MKKYQYIITTALVSCFTFNSFANTATNITAKTNIVTYDSCLLNKIKAASAETTVASLHKLCQQQIIPKKVKLGALSKRIIRESEDYFNPYVITPHKKNYILPASITSAINSDAYASFGDFADSFANVEAKYQLSIKVPLLKSSILFDHDQLFFGMTLQSWWHF